MGHGKREQGFSIKEMTFFLHFDFVCVCVFLFSFSFTFISWRLITLQYCSGFCHTLTWISHGFTCIAHPDPPSHLPLHPDPSGSSQCTRHSSLPFTARELPPFGIPLPRCHQFSSVQSLSHVQLFMTPWTAPCQASLSINNSQSLLKLMSIESVMPSNHLILCCPFLLLPSIFPSIRVFSNDSVLRISGQTIGVSASASVLPMNIQDWSPLGWTGWISLQSKGLSRVFSNTTVQKHQFFGTQLSL